MESLSSASHRLSDETLVSEVARLAGQERRATALFVAALAELDARRLYLPAGCSSMFTYCTQVLHLSEHAAYNRIEAARAARRYPGILEGLAAGDLTLTAVRLLAPCLTDVNHEAVLQTARHKTRREVEHLVAALRPQPDAAPIVRKLPTPFQSNAASAGEHVRGSLSEPESDHQLLAATPGNAPEQHCLAAQPPVTSARSSARPIVVPSAPERYKVQFTASRVTHDKLRRAQALLRHVVPGGDVAEIVDRALTLLVRDLERRKVAAVKRPRQVASLSVPNAAGHGDLEQPPRESRPSRHIPAAVRREVWARDEGRCAYAGAAGRCTERGLLEFHHVVPYADGGEATVRNIELRCRRHNAFEAQRWFGADTRLPMMQETAPTWGR